MVDLICRPPLSAKVIDGVDGPEVFIISSAASLLEGDELSIHLELAAHCHLTVHTVAAQMAHPCPDGGFAALQIDARVGTGSTLVWQPEPTIVCESADFRSSTSVHLADGARATWQEEIILGRSGEPPSSTHLRTHLSVDLGGMPLLRDALDTTRPGAFGPAVIGDARYLGTRLTLGYRTSDPAAMQLARQGSMSRVLDTDVAAGRAALLPLR